MENDIEIKDKNQPVKPPPPSFPSQKEETSNSGAISKFGIHEVLTAEILWAMKVVSSHYSVVSSERRVICGKECSLTVLLHRNLSLVELSVLTLSSLVLLCSTRKILLEKCFNLGQFLWHVLMSH